MKTSQNKLFSIDGNIGAGKTTTIEKLKTNFKNIIVFTEPISKWEEILSAASDNPKKYAFKAQNIILDHFEEVKKAIYKESTQSSKIFVVERSAMTSLSIFTKNYVKNGVIDKKQQQLLKDRVNKIQMNYNKRILVKTSVENCFKRIKIRQRNFEMLHLKVELLEEFHELHEIMYQKIPATQKVVINGNQTKEKVFKELVSIIKSNSKVKK